MKSFLPPSVSVTGNGAGSARIRTSLHNHHRNNNCILLSTEHVSPFAGKMHWHRFITTSRHFWESAKRYFLPSHWYACSFQRRNIHLALLYVALHGQLVHTFISTATTLSPSISFRFPVSSLYGSLAGLGCFVPDKNNTQIPQTYVPILPNLVSRLYSVILLFPLREWPQYPLFMKQISSPVPECLYILQHFLSLAELRTSAVLSVQSQSRAVSFHNPWLLLHSSTLPALSYHYPHPRCAEHTLSQTVLRANAVWQHFSKLISR